MPGNIVKENRSIKRLVEKAIIWNDDQSVNPAIHDSDCGVLLL